MFNVRSHLIRTEEHSPAVIDGWMQLLMDKGGVSYVFHADTTVQPPEDANHLTVPRLIIGYDGFHDNRFAHRGSIVDAALTSGQALLLPAHSWNFPASKRPMSMYSMVFDKKFVRFVHTEWDGDFSHLAQGSYYHWPGTLSATCHHLLHGLLAMGREPHPSAVACLAVNALLRQLSHELRTRDIQPSSASDRHLRAIITYLEENYAKPINLQSVAQQFQLHPNHVSRLFQQQGGETFTQLLTRLRVEGAKSLLRNYGTTVEETAQRCGFRDAGYFRKVFTRQVGVSPSQYRDASAQA